VSAAGAPAATLPPSASRAPGARPPWQLVVFAGALAFLVVAPVAALLYGALFDAAPGRPGSLSLKNFAEAWSDQAAWVAAWTSVWLATARLAVVIPITIFLTWAITRTNMPLRGLIEGVIVSHIFFPFLPLAMAWSVLASPRSGLLNVTLRSVLPFELDMGPLNINSYAGLIFLSALGIPTYLYLLIAPAFRSMDASLEESARMSGAGMLTTLRRVTVPVLAPAIMGTTILAFLVALQSFEPELILGTPAGVFVFSTQIYRYIDGSTVPRYGPATALSLLFLLVTLGLILVQRRALGGRHFTTLSGRGFQVRPLDLGRWRYLVFAVVLAYVLLSTVLPLATLSLASFMQIYGFFGDNWFTTKHYATLLANPKLMLAVNNTIIVAALSAAAAMIVTTITAYVYTRTRVPGRHWLDLLTWMPVTMPGIVLAVGLIWAYVGLIRLPFPFYGTIWLLILALAITALPTGARIMTGTTVQLSADLEESARIHGATFSETVRHVVVPLLLPAMVSGWLVLFAFAVKNFVTVSLLYAPQSVVVSALQLELWNGGQAEVASALATLNIALSLVLVVIYTLVVGRRSRGML
jgi:iron(III) transport system permease protein